MEQIPLRFATEVRHSLHSMLGFLELAVEEPLSERQGVYLAHCRTGADRLLQVAGDLWELSQDQAAPEAGSSFEVATAVSEVADMARLLAERKGLILECALSPATRTLIDGMRGLIQDTLRRVLDNAVRYTEAGSIRLSADVQGEGDAAVLVLEVADTGSGIPEDVLASLRSSENALPDRGLGLAVVRSRIAKMNGALSAVSAPGTGAIVRLTIPVRLASQQSPGQSARAEDVATAPLRLLVAEDSDDCFYLVRAYVSDQGHKLARAHDGAEAVEMAKTGEYDLIVMDANMPVLDGYSATRILREWESNTGCSKRMPILLFSADDPLLQHRLGGAAGCSGYLSKPATKAELLKALQYFAPAPVGVS